MLPALVPVLPALLLPVVPAPMVLAYPSNPCRRGREILHEYLRLYDLVTETDLAKPERENVAFGDPSDYLIGIVPDPDISGHDGYFEAVLEGIEEAVAAGETGRTYVRDRAWMPWRHWHRGRAAQHCAAEEPGVLIFRPQDPVHQHPKIVLLVGETPTWGVRTKQLEAAIAMAGGAHAGESPLRILGPTFSGSAPSLAATLRQAKVSPPSTIVSGTAIQPDLHEIVADVANFSAVVPNEAALLSKMLDYLNARGAESKGGHYTNVALLSESLTAYGSAVQASAAGGTLDPDLCLRFPALHDTSTDAVASSPQNAGASEEGDKPGAKGAREGADTSEEGDPSRPAHEESSPGASATPPSPEALVFEEVARELSRRRVRFVGVVATEASSVLSVTKRLRVKLPDVRFFTLGAHIEYQNPASTEALNGMLIAHAAPTNDLAGRSVSLRNALVRDVFLAGRRLLADEKKDPTTRISMIGNGALWGLESNRTWRDAPTSWWFVFHASLLVLVITVGVVSFPNLIERFRWEGQFGFARHRGPVWGLIGRCEHDDLRADDALVTASLLSVAGSAPLLMCMALWVRGWNRPTLLCLLATILVFGISWSRVLAGAIARLRAPGREPRLASRAAIVFSLVGSGAALCALGMGCRPPSEATLNLLSGGSAVFAGLTGFGMTWLGLWCWRVRLRFLDMHRFGIIPAGSKWRTPPIAQALGETTERGGDLAALEQRLLYVLRSPWLSSAAIPASVHILFAIAVFGILSIRAPAAFEPGWRNVLLVAFGLFSLFPITGNFSRIVATWIVLIRLLHRLRDLPVLERLRELPQALARDLEGQLTFSSASIGELFHPTEVLKRIAARDGAFAKDAREAARLWKSEVHHEAGAALHEGAPAPTPRGEARETTENRARLVDLLLDASGRLTTKRDRLDDKTRALADELLAQIIAIFVPRYVRHFRLFVPPVLVGSALAVLMSSVYFIQPQRLIMTVIFFWVAGMVLVVLAAYTSLDRDAVISALGKTTAGSVELNWSLVRRVITFGSVPIASLFAARYPDFSYWVSLLVNGIGRAIR